VTGHVHPLAAVGAPSLRSGEHPCRLEDIFFRHLGTFRDIGGIEVPEGRTEFVDSAHGVPNVFLVVEFFVQDDPDHSGQ
jgi:hypothetical protein